MKITSLILALVAAAGAFGIPIHLADEAALAHDENFTLDLRKAGVNTVSADLSMASATLTSKTFTGGETSSGTINMPPLATSLSSAAASLNLTVVSTTGIDGASIVFPGYVFTEGKQWRRRSTTALTAASIKAALATIPQLSLSLASGQSVIYATAPWGARYNTSYSLNSSTPSALLLSTTYFNGGQDNASVTINGITLTQGRQWSAGASSATAAANLATAINASRLGLWLTAAQASTENVYHKVTLVAKKNGSIYNFGLSASTTSISFQDGSLLIGGVNSNYVVNTPTITISGHSFTDGLAVLLSTGSGTGPGIGGLTNQTTYYVGVVSASSIKLATSKANALAGTFFNLTSSGAVATQETFTLAPLTFVSSATTGLQWQVANSTTGAWTNLAVSTVSWIAGGGAQDVSWDFGQLNYRYLRAKVVGPVTGGLDLQITLNGSWQP